MQIYQNCKKRLKIIKKTHKKTIFLMFLVENGSKKVLAENKKRTIIALFSGRLSFQFFI